MIINITQDFWQSIIINYDWTALVTRIIWESLHCMILIHQGSNIHQYLKYNQNFIILWIINNKLSFVWKMFREIQTKFLKINFLEWFCWMPHMRCQLISQIKVYICFSNLILIAEQLILFKALFTLFIFGVK